MATGKRRPPNPKEYKVSRGVVTTTLGGAPKREFYRKQRVTAEGQAAKAKQFDNDDGDRAPFEKGEAMAAKIQGKLAGAKKPPRK